VTQRPTSVADGRIQALRVKAHGEYLRVRAGLRTATIRALAEAGAVGKVVDAFTRGRMLTQDRSTVTITQTPCCTPGHA